MQINHAKAYKLLKDLEELDIITVIKNDIKPQIKLSEKYRGVFSAEDAKNFNEYTQAARKQWNNI